MMKKSDTWKVLLAWIGKADLDASKSKLGAESGPIANALQAREFDREESVCGLLSIDEGASLMILDSHAHVDVVPALGWYDTAEKLIERMDEAGIAKAAAYFRSARG